MWNKIKYLGAYIVPIALYVSLLGAGLLTYSAALVAFVFIPFIEFLLPRNIENYENVEEQNEEKESVYSWYLYLNLPLLYAGLWLYFYNITYKRFKTLFRKGNSF